MFAVLLSQMNLFSLIDTFLACACTVFRFHPCAGLPGGTVYRQTRYTTQAPRARLLHSLNCTMRWLVVWHVARGLCAVLVVCGCLLGDLPVPTNPH